MKVIKIKLSEKSVQELLDLEEMLGLEDESTRKQMERLHSQEKECLFG